MRALLRISRYLLETKTWGIIHRRPALTEKQPVQLTMWTDSDFAADSDTAKSVSGYMIFLNGCLIMFDSKQQSTIAQSTTEAELNALITGLNELIFLKDTLCEFCTVSLPMRVHVDNTAAQTIMSAEENTGRTKYLGLYILKAREYVQHGVISLGNCPSPDNTADMLTKALPNETLRKHRDTIMADASLYSS